ncbi:MAG TPA: hypothetical protein VHM20_06780, partial [Gammaproteobacteria bacterium]|nr:hypothetical protein [Gammaproteobacteria bacterium]
MAYIFTEKDRADAIDSEEIRNDFSGFKKIKRLLSFDLREMIGEMKTNPNLNLSLGSRGVKPTLILAMVDNARKSAPSMIGASLGDDKNSDNFYMLKYAAEHPWKALWDIAWPTKFTLNKYDALLIPLLLRFTNYLFYGVTTYLEFGLRNLGAFLLKPLSLVLFGKFDDFNDEPVTLAGWARVVLFCTGIPLVLGFIGQTFIFVANTLRHVRLAIDSVTNFCTSLIRIFSD